MLQIAYDSFVINNIQVICVPRDLSETTENKIFLVVISEWLNFM